mmetsp:Transcript_26355/g.70381  ORF Transcript_26355/g.70381 Transcript_26355/m.70381 type:complete len:181 (-) Transcript_26355:1706-2248(-)
MVDFSYLPVSHINATDGSYECEIIDNGTVYDLDCEGTNFESCLVNEVCWYGDCDTTTQGQLASFMQCYEGPGANSEAEIDPSTRSPCLDQAGFDAEEVMDRVTACTDDEARLDSIKGTLNASKGAADQHHRRRCSDRRPSSVSTADSPAAARSSLPHRSLPRPLSPSFYLPTPLSHTQRR